MHKASRKVCLLIGLAVTLLLANPVWSQQPPPAPAPAATPSPAPGRDAESYVNFGIYKATQGDLDSAVAAFNEALKINPKYAPAYELRGKAHMIERKIDEAIADYDQAVQCDPKSKNAYYQRGSLKGEKGDFEGAIQDFGQVMEMDPTYAPAIYNRGHARYFKGDMDGALTDLNQSIPLDSKSPYGYFIRGLIKHAKGNRTEAASDFEISSGLGFPYAAFWEWIAQSESGQRGIAQENLTNNLTKPAMFKPDDWPTSIGNFLLGKITQDQLLEKGNASANYDKTDHLCEAWFYIGVTKRMADDLKGAQDAFNKAVATQAKSSEEYVEASREAAALPKQ